LQRTLTYSGIVESCHKSYRQFGFVCIAAQIDFGNVEKCVDEIGTFDTGTLMVLRL
jgi:hypothetical protein